MHHDSYLVLRDSRRMLQDSCCVPRDWRFIIQGSSRLRRDSASCFRNAAMFCMPHSSGFMVHDACFAPHYFLIHAWSTLNPDSCLVLNDSCFMLHAIHGLCFMRI